MPLIQLAGDNAERDVEITLKRNDLDIGVEHMFDASRSETFDPTTAVEVDAEGELLDLRGGDEIVMRVVFGKHREN